MESRPKPAGTAGTALRAVFSGLDNAASYRVSVTAKNAVGSGPVSRSALAQGVAVAGGAVLDVQDAPLIGSFVALGILFFSWKKDNGAYNHAAVVTGNNQGVVRIAQHGFNDRDTLAAIMARNRTGPNPIVEVGALRPMSR
ncbi:fibronectin type III domain-containing protein [Streptomyces sp. NBC_00347]|uniref:fibronectin type III domain-containing protein n=1 Tax=Streptomyces sp. NBC_00347 TaxID=2975721 RepID=UPI00225A0390|nr:fibronectin type III domain-containing protein [Streptomyces sp. NBC_00347]MCX5130132.1 fibronectin type III domain-containing protein [Streptomyces sp. NBC_00347]